MSSLEIPNTAQSSFLNLDNKELKSFVSIVQPGVSSFG